MRISDWSSDVCSSDLKRDALRDQVQRREAEYSSAAERVAAHEAQIHSYQAQAQAEQATLQVDVARYRAESESFKQSLAASQADTLHLRQVADRAKEQIDSILMQIGRASCRERVCQYV